MYYTCEDCGEVFDIPFYRKDRVGNKVPCCPACGGHDIEEVDYDYDDFIEYEEIEDD